MLPISKTGYGPGYVPLTRIENTIKPTIEHQDQYFKTSQWQITLSWFLIEKLVFSEISKMESFLYQARD